VKTTKITDKKAEFIKDLKDSVNQVNALKKKKN